MPKCIRQSKSMKLGSLDYIPKQLVEDKLCLCFIHHPERTEYRTKSYARFLPVDSSAFQKIRYATDKIKLPLLI